MIKKILITIAVVAFLTASVQAIDPGYTKKYDSFWPYDYVSVPICLIPVVIDVGYFVQLKDCPDYKIKLTQVPCASIGKGSGDFPCYDGCVDIKVRSNFLVKLGANIKNKASFWGDGSAYWASPGEGITPDEVPAGPGPSDGWHVRKPCVKAWVVKIWEAPGPADEVTFAHLEITVKPAGGPFYP